MRAPAQSPERATGPASAALSGLALRITASPGLAPWAILWRRFAAWGNILGYHPTPLRGLGNTPKWKLPFRKGSGERVYLYHHDNYPLAFFPATASGVGLGAARTIPIPEAIRRRLERTRFHVQVRRETRNIAPALHHSGFSRARCCRPRPQRGSYPARNRRHRPEFSIFGIRWRAIRQRPTPGCNAILRHPS